MASRNVDLHPLNNLPRDVEGDEFDVIVIGSGPVGRTLITKTLNAGLSTLVVEAELFGGDCPFWACIPSKALLRPAEALNSARKLTGAKELISDSQIVDTERVFERRDMFVQNWKDDFLIATVKGCSIVRGKGEIVGKKLVKVSNTNGQVRTFFAKHAVVVATGSDPITPDIKGVGKYWTPRDATSANHVPEHLIVVGGGAVGCEMATAFAEFGGKITLVGRILPKGEPEASRRVEKSLRDRGVKIINARLEDIRGDLVSLSNGETLTGTLLVATGRRANKDATGGDLGTNTSNWLYVIGDASGKTMMTHMGAYHARLASAALIARAKGETKDEDAIAPTSQVVVTDPNVASVGLTLVEAREKGMKAEEVAVTFNFPGAFVHAEMNYDGWAQWVVDIERDVIVGATFVGSEAADLLHASTVAIVAQVKREILRHAVPAFPTMSEIYVALSEEWEARRVNW